MAAGEFVKPMYLSPEVPPVASDIGVRRWARPVRIRRSGEQHCIFSIAFDPEAALIRAYAGGSWSVEETDSYIVALKTFVEGSRSAYGKARVLLDRRDVSEQSDAVAALLAQANGAIFHPDDKIALVVTSSIAKASLRQRMPHPGSKAFLSIEAAETWLRAFGNRI